jgi:hypothetical protein
MFNQGDTRGEFLRRLIASGLNRKCDCFCESSFRSAANVAMPNEFLLHCDWRSHGVQLQTVAVPVMPNSV